MTSPLASKRGISLLAFLITMMGVALIATSYYLNLTPLESGREIEVTMSRMKELKLAARKFLNHTGLPPTNLDDLLAAPVALPTCSVDTNPDSALFKKSLGWCGPYIDLPPFTTDQTSFKTDGFGTTFTISTTTIRSCGPDKVCGNGDDIYDTY